MDQGTISKEEADLKIKLFSADNEESEINAYNDLVDYELKIGRITREEAEKYKN